jgi:hypothetical protein
MPAAPPVPYKLRPNKAVDRELFLSLLSRLAAIVNIETYKYVGLGGPFLEDFRLLHARTGVQDMDCVECEESIYQRQKFNKPIESIACFLNTLERHFESTEFNTPVIAWLDYTSPRELRTQIETYSNLVLTLPHQSILRITLNANPSSLGKPDANALSVVVPGDGNIERQGKTELEWRLDKFRERLADYSPATLTPEDMTHRKYGKSILESLRLAVEKTTLEVTNRKVVWVLSTCYSDGQPMVTATLIILSPDDLQVQDALKNWEFLSLPQSPLIIDLPSLSTLERLTMESSTDPRSKLGYDLPKSDFDVNPFDSFKKFYRFFPHFARIDL